MTDNVLSITDETAPEPFVAFRTYNATRFPACPDACSTHKKQCFYDLGHPISEHRCGMCIQDFFPGLQKSKAALATNITYKHIPVYP